MRETKLHYKMYKSGKQWMFAAVATAIMGTALTTVTTHADTNIQSSDTNTNKVSDGNTAQVTSGTDNHNDSSTQIEKAQQVNLSGNENKQNTDTSNKNDATQNPVTLNDTQNNATTNPENDNQSKETPSNDTATSNQKSDSDTNQTPVNDKQVTIQANATDNQSTLPNGIEVSSDEIATPAGNNFNQYGTLTVKNVVNVTNTASDINVGDQIKFNIANSSDAGSDALMKNAINWNAISVTGGEDYGHFTVDKNTGTVAYTFDKQITLTTGYFTFYLNVPFQQAANSCGVVFSSEFQQKNGNNYPLANFYYGYVPVPMDVSPNRVQAPTIGGGLVEKGKKYAGVPNYDGPTTDNNISQNDNNENSTFDPSKGDEPSFTNGVYPTNGPQESSFNTLTNRTFTVEIQGNQASFDLGGLMFGLPSDGYQLSWAGEASGTWVTLDELKQLLPGTSVDLFQISDNDAKLIIHFPNGATIQYLQFTGNFIAPDVNEKYKVNFGYHDDQGTLSNTSIDKTFEYQTNSGGFFPAILDKNKNTNINVDTFNDANLDNFLLENVYSYDVQDGENKDPISIEKNSDYQALETALANKYTGIYSITYVTRNSLNLTKYKTITFNLYANQLVTDQETTTRTIHYEYSDGRPVPGLSDYSQSADFTRSGERDPLNPENVTWGAWLPVNEGQTKIDVPNPTYPTIAALKGYHPNAKDAQGTINGETQENTPIVVTYAPDAEKATVNYVDDVTGKTISTTNLSGNFGQSIDKDGINSEISKLKDAGYDVVSDNVPDTFTNADNPTYEIHLTHSHSEVTTGEGTETTGTLTVHYQYANGTKASDDVTKTVGFTRTGDKDNVTGKITWNAWTPTDKTISIDSPEISESTADLKTVSEDIKPDQAAKETVIYTVIPVVPEEPAKTITPAKSEKSGTQTKVNETPTPSKPSEAPKQNALPQTGQATSTSLMSIIGAILLSIFGFLGLDGLRKRKEDK